MLHRSSYGISPRFCLELILMHGIARCRLHVYLSQTSHLRNGEVIVASTKAVQTDC